MMPPLKLRDLTSEEQRVIHSLAHSQTVSVRLGQRAKIIEQASQGKSIPQIAESMQLTEKTIRKWFKRFEEQGLSGLEDAPRSGAPSRYTVENKALVLEVAATAPAKLDQPFHCWSLRRLQVYRKREEGAEHEAEPHPPVAACRRIAVAQTRRLVRRTD
jgi:transposase